MSMSRRQAMKLIAATVPTVAGARAVPAMPTAAVPIQGGMKKFIFDGMSSELRIPMEELGQGSPADLSAYSHLAMEMRMSSPQRLMLWVYTAHGPRNLGFIGFGQNAWLREFVLTCFGKYLEIVCRAVRKYDPNHLILGIRFGGRMADEALIAARIFDVCSINVYEYEATRHLVRAARLSGRPVLIGEFHIGVPADGLAAGLVQAKDQVERGIAYRYYVEQAASLQWFVGAYWFAWRDEPVLGRMDGENYNIGFVDVTDRPYVELIEAAKVTHKRLRDVHSARELPFARRPMASDAGAPSSPWPV